MPVAPRSHRLRLAVIGCGLFGLLVVHVSLRYLFSALFGFVTYRGLNPILPVLVLGVYTVLLVALGVIAAVHRGKSGIVLGTGSLLLAGEPLTSTFVWGDGCEVGGSAGSSLLPEVTGDGAAVVVYAWNGSCSTSLNSVVIGVGVIVVGFGLWTGRLPDSTLARWMALVETYWPSQLSE